MKFQLFFLLSFSILLVSCGVGSGNGPGPAEETPAISTKKLQSLLLNTDHCGQNDSVEASIYRNFSIYKDEANNLEYLLNPDIKFFEGGRLEAVITVSITDDVMVLDQETLEYQGKWHLNEEDKIIAIINPEDEESNDVFYLEIESVKEGQYSGPKATIFNTALLNDFQKPEWPNISEATKNQEYIYFDYLSEKKECE